MARQRRTAWATALVLTAALVAPVASAPMADAKPSKPTPTAKAVRDAKAAAAAATRAVLAARAAQSTAQSRLDLLDSRLETAIEHLNAARAAADAAAGAAALDSLVNYEAVRANGGERAELARYDAALARFEGAALRTATSLAALNFGQAAIFSASLAGAMALAAKGVADGSLSVGDVVLGEF